jgi:histidine ammonia-lyase
LKRSYRLFSGAVSAILLVLATFGPAAATPYRTINPQPPADDPVTLTGHDLTIEQLVAVARYGQKVEVSPEAAEHQEQAHNLLLEAAAEGIPIAGFNRDGATVLFEGDPVAPDTAAMLRQKQLALFQGETSTGSEVTDEGEVRAMMAVRANTLTYAPASLPVTRLLVDFLNNRITPVTYAGNPLGSIAAAMIGKGDAYYHGIRMPAAQALAQAGLTPLTPVDDDYEALTGTDAYTASRAALLVADGRLMLEWSDLIFAMDLDGMNAGIAPLTLPAQENRPLKWNYWDAARVLDMLKGSYLLTEDAPEPIPYPGYRSLTSQGAAWRAWAALRDVVLVALNSSDQALAVRPGLSQRETRELSSPRMLKYFVKGGHDNGGERGFIVPTQNRNAASLENDVDNFSGAVGGLNEALAQRITPSANMPRLPGQAVEREQSRWTLETAFDLLAIDLTGATRLMDQRLAENPARTFGAAPTAAWTAFRAAVPGQTAGDAAQAAAARFIQFNRPAAFYPKGEAPPGSDDPIPLAQEKMDR